MAYKIVIDAGHGGEDPGAAAYGRKEKDDNLRLALAVGDLLEKNGIQVIYTRTTDLYETPFKKAQEANDADADLFISFHRNSSPKDDQYNGVETLIYDKSGIKYEMAENIDGAMEKLGFKNLGVKERPGLVVLRKTKMPALLIEAGFINSKKDNELFDSRFQEISRAIADAVLGTLDMEETAGTSLYRVQTGAFKKKENADNLNYLLLDKGYPSFVFFQDGLYKVQAGAFRSLDNAVSLERKLRRDGFPTFITTR